MSRRCELAVVDGMVACPSKGSIDVELCLMCPRLRAFYDDEYGTTMVCRPPRSLNAAQSAALAWPYAPSEVPNER